MDRGLKDWRRPRQDEKGKRQSPSGARKGRRFAPRSCHPNLEVLGCADQRWLPHVEEPARSLRRRWPQVFLRGDEWVPDHHPLFRKRQTRLRRLVLSSNQASAPCFQRGADAWLELFVFIAAVF